jgi:hypothetical protein
MQYTLLQRNIAAHAAGRRIAHPAQLKGAGLTACPASAGMMTMKGLNMKSASTFVAATLAGALCLWTTTNAPAADWSALTMKPRMAASLDAGAKHVVSYFLSADGVCKLTVMIADTVGDDSGAPAAQLQLSVDPGRAARLATGDGDTLRFVCLGRAETMSATTLGRVAMRPGEN